MMNKNKFTIADSVTNSKEHFTANESVDFAEERSQDKVLKEVITQDEPWHEEIGDEVASHQVADEQIDGRQQ